MIEGDALGMGACLSMFLGEVSREVMKLTVESSKRAKKKSPSHGPDGYIPANQERITRRMGTGRSCRNDWLQKSSTTPTQ